MYKTYCGKEYESKEQYDQHVEEDCDYCYRRSRN
jgi:hypothetical protein